MIDFTNKTAVNTRLPQVATGKGIRGDGQELTEEEKAAQIAAQQQNTDMQAGIRNGHANSAFQDVVNTNTANTKDPNAYFQQMADKFNPQGPGTAAPVAPAIAPAAEVPSAPVNHDFINSLQQQANGGISAADIQSQAFATGAENQQRLAAGANTLGGDYASQGAAAQGLDASTDQSRQAQAQVDHETAQMSANGQLTQQLGQEVQQSGSWTKETLNQNVTDASDMINEIQTRTQNATAQQRAAINKASTDYQNLLNQYKVAVEKDQADAGSILGKVKLAAGVLMVAAGVVLTATGAGAAVGVPLAISGGTMAAGSISSLRGTGPGAEADIKAVNAQNGIAAK